MTTGPYLPAPIVFAMHPTASARALRRASSRARRQAGETTFKCRTSSGRLA
jgi:hypothetical protein